MSFRDMNEQALTQKRNEALTELARLYGAQESPLLHILSVVLVAQLQLNGSETEQPYPRRDATGIARIANEYGELRVHGGDKDTVMKLCITASVAHVYLYLLRARGWEEWAAADSKIQRAALLASGLEDAENTREMTNLAICYLGDEQSRFFPEGTPKHVIGQMLIFELLSLF